MDFSKITSVLSDHPYFAAGAVVVGVFLLTRGGGGGNSAGAQDVSASLASLQISSDTNVALAGIQAQKDAIALGANRDVALGAMEYAKADRQSSVLLAVNSMDSSRMTTEANLSTGLSAFQSALGFSAAKKDLENQARSLDYSQSLGYLELGIGRELGAASLTNARDLGIAEINANIDLTKYSLDTDRFDIATQADSYRFGVGTEADVTKFSLPFGERMQLQEQETIRNLAWRQKQIAKIGANASIFNNIIGGLTDVATAGISRGF